MQFQLSRELALVDTVRLWDTYIALDVEKSEASNASATTEKKEAALEEARKALQQAEIGGNSVAVLKASAHLAALEGEKVTGLKPVVLGKGGRERGGGGSWRGRAGRGR